MTNQKKFEIIKALAYGAASEQIADAEEVTVTEVVEIKISCAEQIAVRRDALKQVGYIV